jgi:hypothetical protein
MIRAASGARTRLEEERDPVFDGVDAPQIQRSHGRMCDRVTGVHRDTPGFHQASLT